MNSDDFPVRPLLSPSAVGGLIAGILIFAATLILPPPAGLPLEGWRTLGLALLMAVWWTTEPVPIGITSLMPVIVMPLLGIGDIGTAAAPYANPVVFLFFGGFLLAAAVEKWGLHRRLAYAAVRALGTGPRRLVLGVMTASGLLSMWISNTATVVLLLPVAVSIITALEDAHSPEEVLRPFAVSLLLGLAYSASIAGMSTLISSPPNAMLAGYLREKHGIDLSFVAWSAVALPLVIVFLPLTWLALTRLVFPLPATVPARLKGEQLTKLLGPSGPMTSAERRILCVFLSAALLWATRPLLNKIPGLGALSDPAIALLCASALFLIPSGSAKDRRFLMSWREAQNIPWQVLILFGGGLSLASAMERSGLASWIGAWLAGFGDVPTFLFLLILIATVLMLTELASNTATVATLLPIGTTIAAATGHDIVSISAAITMAASCTFMLPMATPPNALVFATGHVTIAAMIRAGMVMNIISIVLVSLAALTLAPLLPRP